MSGSEGPYLVIVDLDYTLWPYLAENVSNDILVAGAVTPPPPLFDGVREALKELRKASDIVVAVASCSRSSGKCRSILRRHGLSDILEHSRIFPGTKDDHCAQLCDETNIRPQKTALLDDCSLFRKQATRIGVLPIAVDASKGLTRKDVLRALAELKSRQRSKQLMRSFLSPSLDKKEEERRLQCPICLVEFKNVSRLVSHASSCDGSQGAEEKKAPNKRQRERCAAIFGKRKRKESKSTFEKCPICFRNIHRAVLAAHASTCVGAESTSQKTTIRFSTKIPNSSPDSDGTKNALACLMGKKQRVCSAHPDLPGCQLFKNFLSEAEEAELIDAIDQCDPPWKFSSWNGSCDTKTWGVEVDVVARTIGPAKRPIPGFMSSMIDRMCSGDYLQLAGFRPNECNANSYIKSKGHWLRAHVDDRQLSGELLANVSLGADASMLYTHEASGRQVRVFLPRRCLQIVAKESRYDWTHEIEKSEIFGARRVSITFRGNGVVRGSRRGAAVGKPLNSKYTL
eukprot:g941.t1